MRLPKSTGSAESASSPPYFRFHVWYNIADTLNSLYKKIFWINWAFCKIWCNVDISINQNLKLLSVSLILHNLFLHWRFSLIRPLAGFAKYQHDWYRLILNKSKDCYWWFENLWKRHLCHHWSGSDPNGLRSIFITICNFKYVSIKAASEHRHHHDHHDGKHILAITGPDPNPMAFFVFYYNL